MSLQRVCQKITTALDQAGVAFMLTGSFASAYHGSPRSTISQLELTKEWNEALRLAEL
ncbi:MAG: hypothetical protein ACRD20_14960 [Terriglobales bacterium]